MPDTYAEFCQLKSLCPENRIKVADDKLSQKYRWVNDIGYKGNCFDVLELYESSKDKQTRFV